SAFLFRLFFFFFTDTASSELYTLSLHDALPISLVRLFRCLDFSLCGVRLLQYPLAEELVVVHVELEPGFDFVRIPVDLKEKLIRSEEHTSELQSRSDLVCRLLLEKKKNIN